MVCCLVLLSSIVSAYDSNANNNFFYSYDIKSMRSNIADYIEALSVQDDSYTFCINATFNPISELYDNSLLDISSLLFGIYVENEYKGYVIIRNSDFKVLESALCDIPYNMNSLSKSNDSIKWVYDYGNYAVSINNAPPVYLSSNFENDQFNDAYFKTDSLLRSNLPNVPIFLQKSYTCIVCATSHLLLYWNNNGFNGLTPIITSQSQFESLMTTVASHFTSYTNNNIPGSVAKYAATRTPNPNYGEPTGNRYVITAINRWYPDYSDVTSEISNSRPVYLGYAAGSDYSPIAGHMTMCVGARTSILESNYVAVVDGHSSSIVTKIWADDYNDFICSVIVDVTL